VVNLVRHLSLIQDLDKQILVDQRPKSIGSTGQRRHWRSLHLLEIWTWGMIVMWRLDLMIEVSITSEKWLPISGFDNYVISNFGRVKIFERIVGGRFGKVVRKERFVRQSESCGYLICRLGNEEGYKMFKVHRLVALHFIVNPKNKPFVNHLDCNKKNNNVKNLEWCTNQENVDHAREHGRLKVGEEVVSSKLTPKQVMHIRNNLNNLTLKQVAKLYGVSFQAISLIRRGDSWSHLKL
jgi:hypothetical protein